MYIKGSSDGILNRTVNIQKSYSNYFREVKFVSYYISLHSSVFVLSLIKQSLFSSYLQALVSFIQKIVMAFAAAMGIDFAISAITMAAALAPVGGKPAARIGIGSTQLSAKEDARTNGVMPNLYLYNVQGKRFAKHGMFSPVEFPLLWLFELIANLDRIGRSY